MKIVIAGGTGLLGTLLARHYHRSEHEVVILSRKQRLDFDNIHYCKWDGKNPGYWCGELESADVLINLNGKSVDCRYTEANKQLIYDTRLDATNALGKAILNCKNPPKLWINAASATIYPHSLDREMAEDNSLFDSDFSVDVCKKWEGTFHSFELQGTRKVIFRIGIVMSKNGSALAPLKALARLGFGGRIGKGSQMVNWLHEKDFVNAVEFVIANDKLKGVFNVTSPNPVRNRDLMNVLRKVMGIPIGMVMPEWLLQLGAVFIGTEPELVLKSRFVIPQRLLEEGYHFEFPQWEKAVKDLVTE